MNRFMGISLGLAAGIVLLSPDAVGQVFKCKDANGKVTYADAPCLPTEANLQVDTRPNIADHSAIRKEAARMQASVRTEVREAPPAAAASAGAPVAESPPPVSAATPASEPSRDSYRR